MKCCEDRLDALLEAAQEGWDRQSHKVLGRFALDWARNLSRDDAEFLAAEFIVHGLSRHADMDFDEHETLIN